MEKEEVKVETPVNEDAELDKALEDSIAGIKAGKVLEIQVPTDPKTSEASTPAGDKVEEPAKPPIDAESKEPEYDFRIPNKGKFESDESFEKRVELMDLVKRRKLAKTDDQRQEISDQIKTTKGQLRTLNGTDRFTNPLTNEVSTERVEEDETLMADRERLRELGGATTEDIQKIVQQERLATEVKGTLDRFIDRHTQLKDTDTREVFFDFVDSNFAWQNKTGKELMTVLELARESMFKPSETMQDRVLRGANVQEKVNAMQFPGGTLAKTEYSPDMKKSIDELKATGMSEEKALELLSE